MKDQLIIFETAKLAKEKGFNIPCPLAYHEGNLEGSEEYLGQELFDAEDIDNAKLNDYDCYLAPTQSLLQKWLREEHKINVDVLTGWENMDFTYEIVIWVSSDDRELAGKYKTHESALEMGLLMVLKLL